MHYTTDICIVGAGPGGAIASDTLSRSGIRHLLIDRTTFPRNKVCGDVVTRGVVRILSRRFPHLLPALIREGRIMRLSGAHLYIGDRSVFAPFHSEEFKELGDCFSMIRSEFDQLLLNEVTHSPYVTFRTGIDIRAVEHQPDGLLLSARNGDTIHCTGAIFATGASMSTLRMLGFDPGVLSQAVGVRSYYRNLTVPVPNETYMFVDRRIMPGGMYITPEPDGLFNVNYVVLQDHVVRHSVNVQQVMESFIAEHPVLRTIFAQAEKVQPTEGASLFLGFRDLPVSGERFIITGDTASLTDIVSANGIPQTMISNEMAALYMKECLADGDLSKQRMARFDARLHTAMKHRLQVGRLAYPFLTRPWLSDLLLRILTFIWNRPNAGSQLAAMFTRPQPLRALFNPLFYYRLLRSRPV